MLFFFVYIIRKGAKIAVSASYLYSAALRALSAMCRQEQAQLDVLSRLSNDEPGR